jgi:hypothetical protein
VRWLNETEETCAAWDIELAEPGRATQFVEVKTTALSGEAPRFEISWKQVEALQRTGDAYSLYRVQLLGESGRVRLTRLRNPAAAMRRGSVRLMLELGEKGGEGSM